MAREAEEWPTILPQIQYAINSCVSRATGITPFELFFGEKAPPLVKLETGSLGATDMPDIADPEALK